MDLNIDVAAVFRMLCAAGLLYCFVMGFFYRAIARKTSAYTLLIPVAPILIYALATTSEINDLVRTLVIGIIAMLCSFGIGAIFRSALERGSRPNGGGITIDRSYALMRTAAPKGSRVDRRV
jgi:hypothetical protein